MYVVLVLTILQCANLAAQDRPASFEEVASEATAAREVDDAPRAIELYRQAVQLNPKWEEGWWFLGLLQYGTRSYASATEALSRFLEMNPKAGQALALRGLCEFELEAYPQSLEDIQNGIAAGAAQDAQHAQTLHYHEAILLTRLGRFQDALRVYLLFAEHGLSSPELFLAIGAAGLRVPLLPKEIPEDQRALLTAVGNAAFKFMQADQDAAQQAFNDLFQRYPSVRNAHFLYGNLLYEFGPDAAAVQFRKELDIAPENADARIMLAWSLLMQNLPAEALSFARRAAEQEPQRAAAQVVFGRALLDTGNVSGGIEVLERAGKLEPDNLEIHIALANAYSKSGRDDDARRERALCLQMTRSRGVALAHP